MQQRDAAPAPQAEAFCPPGNSPSGWHWAPEKPVQRAGTYSAFIFDLVSIITNFSLFCKVPAGYRPSKNRNAAASS